MTGIASDFNELLLNISDQAQLALTEQDSSRNQEISTRLNAVMESSRHAHDLIVRMLAYQSTASDKTDRTDLSEAAKQTFSLLQQSIATHLNITHNIEPDLHAAESDVIELQKILIQMFQYLNDSVHAAPSDEDDKPVRVLAELKVNDYLDQSCACCYQRVDGQYLELSLASGEHANGLAKPLLHLANELADDPSLRARIDALHDQLETYNGHIMLQDSDEHNQDWRLLLPIAGAGTHSQGIRLDKSVQLEKYRQRKRKHNR